MEHNEEFRFTYSAQQQKEVEAIRRKYLPREEDRLEQLRKLHAVPARRALKTALALGIIGALLLGTGMSLVMTELGMLVGNYAMPLGIGVGLLGLLLAALAYPCYNRVLRRQREKIAPEILRLSDELLK